MNKSTSSYTYRYILLCAAALVLVGCVATTAFLLLNDDREYGTAPTHDRRRIQLHLDGVMGSLFEMMVSNRGFLFTRDSSAAKAYIEARDKIFVHLDSAHFFIRNEQGQLARLNIIREMIKKRIAKMESGDSIFTVTKSSPQLQHSILSGDSLQHEVRKVMQAMNAYAEAAIQKPEKPLYDTHSGALMLITLLGFITVGITYGGFHSLKKDIRNKESAKENRSETPDHMAESEARYRNLVNASSDAIIISDQEGNIISWNHTAGSVFGYSAEEALGRPLTMIMPVKYHEAYTERIQSVIRKGAAKLEGERTELEGRHKSGETFPMEMTLTHWISDGAHFFSVTIRNITEQKNIQNRLYETLHELKRSNEDLEQFAYVASHDLQEPLRKIRAFGDRLINRMEEVGDPLEKEYTLKMVDAAMRMQTLIQDLLAFSMVSRDMGERQNADLNEIIMQVIEDLQISIKEAGAVVHISRLPVIPDANAIQMQQLFQNLLSNAIKFRQENTTPEIRITATELKGQQIPYPEIDASPYRKYYQVTVKDNGVGFEEKYLERVFTIFQRLHGRGQYSGTGIGLAVCKRICQNHSGFITARSTPGKGTTFIVYLPKD